MNKTKKKILFLCHFSTAYFRELLDLKDARVRMFIFKLLGRNTAYYQDFAIWVSDYVEEFEKHPEFEFHIVSPHAGMRKRFSHFERNGIFYHFYKCTHNFIYAIVHSVFHLEEKNNYKLNREKIKELVSDINPDLVILCGAENPYYSLGVLDIMDKPIYVILQTLLNDPKRIAAKVASEYRTKMESEIFKHAGYFCTGDQLEKEFITKCNSNAVFLPAGFPTHRPSVVIPEKKAFDFVFFAREVVKNKGIEDVIKALAIVKENKPTTSLNIIGGVLPEYKQSLVDLILELGIKDNVNFAGFYNDLQDTYNDVVRACVVVVPGITAALNSTVRESMLIGMPTVVYETSATPQINREKTCLFVAKMADVNDLAKQMLLALNNTDMRMQISSNGKEFADKTFGNEAIVKELLSNSLAIIDNKLSSART